MTDLILFPYLYLANHHKRVHVGSWVLIPKAEVRLEDALSPEILELAQHHLALYSRPNSTRDEARNCGCFVTPAAGRLGDPIAREGLHALQLSVLAGLLAENPGENELNAGNRVATSDNAVAYGHPLNEEGRVVLEYGAMMKMTVAGIRAAQRPGYISHAPELHLPDLGSHIDEEIADAVHRVLSVGDDPSRRLGTSIEWLDVAWRNSRDVTAEVRVMALKSAFEVLLDAGDGIDGQLTELSNLLDVANAPTNPYTRTNKKGQPIIDQKTKQPIIDQLTDLQWWFTKLTHLRNAIAHGSAIPAAEWTFNGSGQIMLAQRRLLDLIQKKLADALNDPLLCLPSMPRRIERRWAQMNAQRQP